MRSEMTGLVVPSKLYGAMASARPTLFVGPDHCETADAIRRTDCGLTIRPGDTNSLVEALQRLCADPEAASRMGARGREAFLAEFERGHCCARWGSVIGELVGSDVAGEIEKEAVREQDTLAAMHEDADGQPVENPVIRGDRVR